MTTEWFAYIHEHGHMVHNSMYSFGSVQSYTSLPDNNSYTRVHEINRKEVTYLNDPRTPCQPTQRGEEMNHCIQHYIENRMGCQLPWYASETTLPKCTTPDQYGSFLKSYAEIAKLSGFSISKKTGCLPSCKLNEFTATIKDDVSKMDGGAELTGLFYYPGGQYIQKKYSYTYDFTSYIADVGGLVGLFLGYSMLSVYDNLKNIWKK